MKNTDTTQITEADVIAFMQSKQAELRKATGVEYSSIAVEIMACANLPVWRTYSDGGKHLPAKTADDAIAAQVELVHPLKRAEQARLQAARLIAEAEMLEATK